MGDMRPPPTSGACQAIPLLAIICLMNSAPLPIAALAMALPWRWGLRERLGAALGALLVAATLALSLLLAAHAQTSLAALAKENIDALSSQMARELSHGMDRFAREIQLQATRPVFSKPDSTPDEMRRELEVIQKTYPEFAYLSVVDIASAKVVAATGGIFEGGSAKGRDIFEQGQKALFVADVHDAMRLANLLPKPASGEPLRFLDIAAPIRVEGEKPARVLAAHLSWEWTKAMKEQVLAPAEAGRKVQIMLVDTAGRVVLTPDGSTAVGKPLTEVLGPAGADGSKPWSDGRTYLRADAPTFAAGASPGLGWRVIARQPLEAALASSDSLRRYFLAGGLALGLLSAIGGWFWAARIVRPVEDLARDAAALAPGANLPAAPGDEPLEVALVRGAFQRVAGDALARAERLMGELETVYRGAPVGLCVVGRDLRYARANQVWAEAFGFEPDGGSGASSFADRAPAALVDAVKTVFEMGTAWSAEVSTGAQERERVWQTVLAPVNGSDGRPAAVSVVATEVTEMRRAERELRLADERKTQFIAMLAHELRNPLAPVRSALEVLNRGPAEPLARRMRQTMDRQVTHMVRLIDDLLDVSRMSLGKIAMRLEPTAIHEVCEAAADSARHLIAGRGQTLSIDADPALPRIHADKARLEQVVCNLLINASKYGNQGGRLALSAVRDGQRLLIAVEDDGRGISAEFLPRVFDLFEQGDSSLARTEGGLGIGLAMVKNLVELHGGSVEAHSDGLGAGSRFSVWLPLTNGREQSLAPELAGSITAKRVA
jgi:signal transduction histidine kinase